MAKEANELTSTNKQPSAACDAFRLELFPRANRTLVPKIAVVLYSYSGRQDRQRVLARLCYQAVARIPNVAVYVTTTADDIVSPASCYRSLRLDIPDGYEYLPDKTLAMLRWFAAQEEFDYLLKCDDDVFLDPCAVSHLTLDIAMPHYQGVDVQALPAGTTTMKWHRGKCRSHTLNENDTSAKWAPPGFTFALGTCYMLSRDAAQHALDELESSGFILDEARLRLDCRAVGCEDILVADLLARRNIFPVHSMRIMYANGPLQILNHYRYELLSRLKRRSGHKRCIGVCTPNRAARPVELPLLALWPVLSRWIPVSSEIT